MDEAGGKGLALMVDIRDEEAVAKSIEETVRHFGGIDILINNASAIALTGTEVCVFFKFFEGILNFLSTPLCTLTKKVL